MLYDYSIGRFCIGILAAANSMVSFLVKVIVTSALLSVLLKYGGPLLPIDAPYTERLNGLAVAIIVLPSVVVGTGLVVLFRRGSA